MFSLYITHAAQAYPFKKFLFFILHKVAIFADSSSGKPLGTTPYLVNQNINTSFPVALGGLGPFMSTKISPHTCFKFSLVP